MKAPHGVGTYPSLLTNGKVLINGTFQEELYIKQKAYHYVSSPIAPGGNATSDLYCRNRADGRFNSNFYTYDETVDLDGNPSTAPSGDYDSQNLAGGWVLANNGSSGSAVPMQVNRGYAVWDESDNLIVYQGQPNNGSLDVTDLSYTNNDPVPSQQLPNLYDGWQFVGNPYPSYINWDSIAKSLTHVDNAIYLYDGNHYVSYVNGVVSGNGNDNVSQFIAPMQGFFIHVNANNAGYTQNNSCRTHSTSQIFLKKAKATKSTTGNIIKLKMDIGTGRDMVAIYFTPRATTGFDSKYDAIKMFSSSYNTSIPDIFTHDGNKEYSIEALPLEKMYSYTIPVGYVMKSNGSATISVDEMNFDEQVDAYLYDKQQDSLVKLSPGVSYTFTSNSGKITNRFEIRFYKEVPPTAELQIGHIYAYEDKPLYKYYDKKAFIDYNGDTITLKVVDDKGYTPSWVRYDNEFNSLIIKAGNDQVGDHNFRLQAIDTKGKSNDIPFTVTVINVNDAPELVKQIPDTTLDVGGNIDLNIAQYFNDIDRGDTLTFSASLADGSELPTWLHIDSQTGEISGQANDIGSFDIMVTAQDKAGASVSGSFVMTVKGLSTAFNNFEKNKIVIYPNPAHDFAQIYNGYDKQITMKVYDETGKLLMTKKLSGKKDMISVRSLAQGKYLVQFDLGDKTITQKLIVK